MVSSGSKATINLHLHINLPLILITTLLRINPNTEVIKPRNKHTFDLQRRRKLGLFSFKFTRGVNAQRVSS